MLLFFFMPALWSISHFHPFHWDMSRGEYFSLQDMQQYRWIETDARCWCWESVGSDGDVLGLYMPLPMGGGRHTENRSDATIPPYLARESNHHVLLGGLSQYLEFVFNWWRKIKKSGQKTKGKKHWKSQINWIMDHQFPHVPRYTYCIPGCGNLHQEWKHDWSVSGART